MSALPQNQRFKWYGDYYIVSSSDSHSVRFVNEDDVLDVWEWPATYMQGKIDSEIVEILND